MRPLPGAGDGRSECVSVPLRSQLPTDSLTGLAGLAVPAPNRGLFWESGAHCARGLCRKKGPGLVGVPIEQVEGDQKEAEK